MMSTMGYGTTRSADPRPMVPALARHYAWMGDVGYLLLRVTAGLMLIPHVMQKFKLGMPTVAANVMAKSGVEPALPAAYLAAGVETIGIVCITLGLLTRVSAALLVIEFLVIMPVHYARAGWPAGAGGAEFPFLWFVVLLAILLRGGGPYSVDRKLGWEI